NQRLGHKGRSFAVLMRNVVYAVLEDLYFVRFLHQSVSAYADFTLASVSNFMVMDFNFQAHRFHRITHGATDVVQRIDWRNREVTAFYAWRVAVFTFRFFT